MGKRVEWLDVAKGMAIILVVLGHSSLPALLNRYIFAFHMPFFFFASGYTSDFNKYSFGEYICRKAKVLLLPFFIYSVINLILQPYVSDLTYQEYWVQFLSKGWLAVPLWFVPVLFIALLIAKLVFMIENRIMRLVLIGLLPSFSVVLKYLDIWLPWNISVVPYASFLIVTANYFKRYYKSSFLDKTNYKLLLMIVCMSATFGISYYWKLDLCWNNILPLIPLLVGAIAGSIFLSLSAMLIVKYCKHIKKILVSIGRETYLILAFAEVTIVYLNYFFTLNSAIKYILLIFIVFFLCRIKKVLLRFVKKTNEKQ